MFKKILIAEDLDSISLAVQHVLNELQLNLYMHDKYCEGAYLKIKKALVDNEPFDLLITDLSLIAISCAVIPIKEKTIILAVAGTSSLYFPSFPVIVATAVFLTTTLTPCIGFPLSSVTVPVTDCCAKPVTVIHISSSRNDILFLINGNCLVIEIMLV